MRASRSACVVQVMLVPAELTLGSAAQLEDIQNMSEFDICRDPHCRGSTGLENEFAADTLRKGRAHAGVLALRARAGGGEGLELVAVRR
jgi:hypothetical protein